MEKKSSGLKNYFFSLLIKDALTSKKLKHVQYGQRKTDFSFWALMQPSKQFKFRPLDRKEATTILTKSY